MKRLLKEARFEPVLRAIAELASGAAEGTCWEVQAGDFWVAFNPHAGYAMSSRGQRIESGRGYVEHMGRAAAFVGGAGGMLLSNATGWTVGELVAAMAAIRP